MILIAAAVLLVAEISALVAVAHQIGVLATILLLIAGSVIGGWLLRREGTRAWRAFTTAVAEGRPPGREALDGMLVLVGGALVLFPGFVSDVLGLLCLLPPSRRALSGVLRWYAARRVRAQVVRVRAQRGPAVPPDGRPHDPGGSDSYGPGDRPGLTGRDAGPAGPAQQPGAGKVIEGEVEP